MRWIGRRGSSNVEDRRGSGTGKMVVGGGIGTIIIAIIVMLMGGDPGQMLGGFENTQSTTETSTVAEDSMAQFVSVVLADTEEVWAKLFENSGQTYRNPKLVLFRGQVESACGYASAASGPFYCPGDEKVYIDLSFCDELKNRFGAPGDFAIAYVIAHEVGHHVQKLLGVLDNVNEQRQQLPEVEANKLTVRLELQADFYAGIWAYHAQQNFNILEPGDIEEALGAASAVGDDNLQMQSQGRVVPDAFTHGSSAQRMKWFKKGWDSGDPAVGDTFARGAV
jgi:uncharacterized protein